MILSHWLASKLQRSTMLRCLGIGSCFLMLSSLVLPWLLLPFDSSFPCGAAPGHLAPHPPDCPAEGAEAVQVSLWQVFTHQIPHAITQSGTYIGMLPVGMAAIILVLLFSAAHDRLLLARLGYVCAMLVGLVAQGMVTFVVSALPSPVITTVTPLSVLLALPYLVYLLTGIGGLALWLPADLDTMREDQHSSQEC
jgi:hypothetical protein